MAVAVILVALPATSGAAVRSATDRDAGVRLTLKGRVLTATLLNRTSEEKLFGKRIRAACSGTLRFSRRSVVIRRRVWPAHSARVSFAFRRDISRRAKWCLIEHGRGDVAVAWFVRRERVRFVAKGRGPSGDWWRLGGSAGRYGEPCALLRIRDWSTRPCFFEFFTRRATLGARAFAPCDEDVHVFGVATRRWERARVLLTGGGAIDAALYEPPRRSEVRERYFAAVLPQGTEVAAVEVIDASGDRLRRGLGNQTGTPCPA